MVRREPDSPTPPGVPLALVPLVPAAAVPGLSRATGGHPGPGRLDRDRASSRATGAATETVVDRRPTGGYENLPPSVPG